MHLLPFDRRSHTQFPQVTSSEKLSVAKSVADAFVRETVSLLGSGAGDGLRVEQVKVTNEEGGLKVVYPAKTDLINMPEGVKVVRP